MDTIVPDLLKLGLPGVVILVELWVIRFLFNWGEEKGKKLLELSVAFQEDTRRDHALIAELTTVLRDQISLSDNVRQLLQEFRDRNGRRR